jgi:DNA-binding GntR family transcriptional regulator
MSPGQATNGDLATILGTSARDAGVVSTADRIAGSLRAAILSGGIARGTPLTESAVSATLGISRNTAREALRLLTGEGLLVHEPHHSPVVALLGPDDVADVFAVRTVLESAAADMIGAARDGVDLSPLTRSVARMSRLVGTSADQDVTEADLEFHVGLIACSGSARLSTAYARLESEIRLCLSISTRAHADVSELVEQHQQLLASLERGATDRFKADLRHHLDVARDRVAEALRAGRDADSDPLP